MSAFYQNFQTTTFCVPQYVFSGFPLFEVVDHSVDMPPTLTALPVTPRRPTVHPQVTPSIF